MVSITAPCWFKDTRKLRVDGPARMTRIHLNNTSGQLVKGLLESKTHYGNYWFSRASYPEPGLWSTIV